ncbi:alpha/beta hydrolase [Nocardiopsis quinghaiensis]|uniref:alpha/beta hydrolase n=1 Tax=Nocardiopsis quinghaiensis TaxID=464995 RepID=UPI0012391162|nr:alpha/beta hydrolase fold domain-containing protein [Nocardiopsis quinghaiensis]
MTAPDPWYRTSPVLQPTERFWRPVRATAGGHSVPARVHLVQGRPVGWLVWAHGGSWRGGSAAEWHHATAALARISGCLVVSVDYRLSPRHTHPAPVEDVLVALAWVRSLAGRSGLPTRIAVGGDSAGGTIAAAAAVAEAEAGEPLAMQVLAYPPFDPLCRADSYRTNDSFPTAEGLRESWRAHRGARPTVFRDGRTLHSSPLDAEDLAGVAPAVLAVGDRDPVRDDVTAYARLLNESGGSAELHILPRTGHGALLSPVTEPTDIRHRLAGALRARFIGSAAGEHATASVPHEGTDA